MPLGHRGDVTAVAVDSTGTRVVTASADHTAKLWDATTGKLLVSLDHTDEINTAAFSADSARVITSTVDRRLWIWNAKTGAHIAKLDGNVDEYPVRLSQDGTRVMTANMYDRVRIKSVDTGTTVAELEGNENPVYVSAFERQLTAGRRPGATQHEYKYVRAVFEGVRGRDGVRSAAVSLARGHEHGMRGDMLIDGNRRERGAR